MKVPKKFLNKFAIIEEECTAVVQSMHTVTEDFLYDTNGEHRRYNVVLRAFSIDNYEAITNLIDSEEGDSIDLELLYPFLLKGVIWKDKVTHVLQLPTIGENLICTFKYNDLDELQCTNIVFIEKVKPKKFNLEKYIVESKILYDE